MNNNDVGSFRKVTLCMAMLFCYALLSAQVKWEDFKYDNASFKVSSPGMFKVITKELATSMGVITTTNYSISIKEHNPNFLYTINHIMYEDGTLSKDSIAMINALMEETLDGVIESNKTKLIYKTENTSEEYQGLIFRCMNPAGIVIKGKIIVRGDHAYILMVYTHNDKSLNLDMDRFLDSFQLL